MKRQILLLLLITCITSSMYSQSTPVIIHGKITGEKNETLSNVSVKIKNTRAGTASDNNGGFRLSAGSLPVTLVISHVNYSSKEVVVENANEISVQLSAKAEVLDPMVIMSSKGIPTRILEYAGSAERIGPKEIAQSPASSIYDILRNKKGIDVTSSSLTFNTPSTRGFNGSGSTRVNQIVDGMDNQAPGLNFFVGNFAGLSDIDMESIELLPGASSALYGPGGMNGTILINSKNPFKSQGLSVVVKPGMMHVGNSPRGKTGAYHDYSFRYAKSINDKFAFKVGAQLLNATDWLANDSTNYLRNGTSGKLIGGNRRTDANYDGVNIYGDETSINMFGVSQSVQQAYITGINQSTGGMIPNIAAFLNSMIPVNTSYTNAVSIINTNFVGPLEPLKPTVRDQLLPFYLGLRNGWIPDQNVSRTGYAEKDVIDPVTKNLKFFGALHYKINDKIEAQLMANWAKGNSVYTDDNRYALKGVTIAQYKFELKHKNWFLRTYTTQENAGEAYSATVATQYLNEAWKQSQQWYPEYVGAFVGAIAQGASPGVAHNAARDYADIGRPAPGSQQFKQIFDQVRKTPIPNGGLFKEKSQLWMSEGQYTFGDAKKNAEIIVGGNYKRYILNSGGTLFIDTLRPISSHEIGGYVQLTKKLFDEKLTLVGSGRMDKNENFKAQFTPRIAALINVAKDNNIRVSYQTAYRFPGNLTQWIRLDVGGDYLLLGGLPWVQKYMDVAKNPVHLINADGSVTPTPYVFNDFKPETMRSFEVGYKGLIKNKLLIDAYVYAGSYKDFIGRIGLYQPGTGEAFSIVVNSDNKVKTYGFGLGMDYRMSKNYSVFFNVYSDEITDVPTGFKSYFNTPKYRFNAGFGNSGFGKDERLSFNALMRWQDSFNWEGELANGPVNAFVTADAQVSYKFPKVKTTMRLGGTNIFNNHYKNAYGNPMIGGLYYASFIYNL
jgi:outer membrane receptor protein involved in Fe transport